MKKQIKTTEAIFPMPVLLIATFNEDGTVNVMNAAWGTMVSGLCRPYRRRETRNRGGLVRRCPRQQGAGKIC